MFHYFQPVRIFYTTTRPVGTMIPFPRPKAAGVYVFGYSERSKEERAVADGYGALSVMHSEAPRRLRA